MTTLSFFNGLREIGGTFVEVETEKAKCMFDFGFAAADRTDEKVRKRPDSLAADCVRLGMLTPADGIYGKKDAEKIGVKAYGETGKKCFFLLSHMHIDHMGGLGMLHPEIPVYMSEDSCRLYRRLEANGDIQEKGHENCIGIPYGESFAVEDITVKVLAIDHDVVGASGFLITTPDGTICYTGDYRFHGFHPEATRAFAEQAKGVDVLITEGVTVSFDDVDMLSLEKPEEPERTEETLQQEMKQLAEESRTDGRGLIIINPYNRNVERLHRLIHTFRETGRILVLDPLQADYVAEFYPEDPICVYQETFRTGLAADEQKAEQRGWQLVSREELLVQPEKFVLQLDYSDSRELLDLHPAAAHYIHMDGAPLGDYDPSFQKLLDLVELLHIPYEYKGLGGHAKPYYLRTMVDTIAPGTLIPLHSFRPEQVQSEKAGSRILPEYGACYRMESGRLTRKQ